MPSKITLTAVASAVLLVVNVIAPVAAQASTSRATLSSAPSASTSEPVNAETFDTATAPLISQTASSNTYDAGKGYRVTELLAGPANIRQADGTWTEISTSIKANSDGTLAVENNPLHPTFAENAEDAHLLKVSNGGDSLAFTLLNGESSSAATRITPDDGAANSGVTYQDATTGGADLTYEVASTSVKETIKLGSIPTAEQSHWTWAVSAPGLTIAEEFGDIRFLRSDGTVRFTIPAPRMWDSSGIAGVREAADHVVATTIVSTAPGAWHITLAADPAWLNAPDRVYPVFVDPSTQLGDGNVKTWKSTGYSSTDYVKIGNTRESGTNVYWRSQVRYALTGLFGKQVTDASINVSRTDGTTTLQGGSVNTSSCTGYSCVGDKLGNLNVDTDGVTSTPHTTFATQISDWINAGEATHQILFRGAEDAGVYTYKQINTSLKVVWKDFPQITGAVDPSPSNSSNATTTPTLSVGVADVDGSSVQVRYTVSTSPSFAGTPSVQSTWQAVGPWTVPAGLVAGTNYYWRATVKDSNDGLFGTNAQRNSSTWNFTTRAQPNSYVPSISCDSPYAAGGWSATMPSTNVSCTVTTPFTAGAPEDGRLEVYLDDDLAASLDLSTTGPTTKVVSLPASPGLHSIHALTSSDVADASATVDYSIGFGNWAGATMSPVPATQGHTDAQPYLVVSPQGDVFSSDVLLRYTVSTNPDGVSSPVLDSGWVPTYYAVPVGSLAASTMYYWKAQAQGTSGGSTTVSTINSPVWSFTTDGTAPTLDSTTETGLRSFLTQYNVSAITQDALIDKFARVGTWDSLTSGATPVSTATLQLEGAWQTKKMFADGSITVETVEDPEALCQANCSSGTSSVHDCTKTTSGASKYFSDCTVSFWSGAISMSFQADYVIVVGGYDKITTIYNPNWFILGACSTSIADFQIARKKESKAGRALAVLTVTAHACLLGVGMNFYVKLVVGNNKAYETHIKDWSY